MAFSSTAIVLNSLKYGDNSLITKLYTAEKGIVTVISSLSTSKRKSKFHHYLQPLSLVNIICSDNKKQSIIRLKEIAFAKDYVFDQNILKGTIRIFLAELLSKLVHEEEVNESLFHFLVTKCLELQKCDDVGYFTISFLSAFTKPLGIEPNLQDKQLYFDLLNADFQNQKLDGIYLTEEDSILFYNAFNMPDEMSRQNRRKAINLLLDYYRHQFGVELKLKSLTVLDEVFT